MKKSKKTFFGDDSNGKPAYTKRRIVQRKSLTKGKPKQKHQQKVVTPAQFLTQPPGVPAQKRQSYLTPTPNQFKTLPHNKKFAFNRAITSRLRRATGGY